jgi:hypothetical protein
MYMYIPIAEYTTGTTTCSSSASHVCNDGTMFSHCTFENCQPCLDIDQTLTSIIELYQPKITLDESLSHESELCLIVRTSESLSLFPSSRERLSIIGQLVTTLNSLHMPKEQIQKAIKVLTQNTVASQIS